VHRLCSVIVLLLPFLSAQVIEFESGGLRYQTLTRNGLTIMFAPLPQNIRDYVIFQVAIQNGSRTPFAVKPEDFSFQLPDGEVVRATPARTVIREMLDKAERRDVLEMVSAYEMGIYGLQRVRSSNGYEQRRQDASAMVAGPKLKAAAAASAIAFVPVRLPGGQSADGALFVPRRGRKLEESRLQVQTSAGLFEFQPLQLLSERSQP
jgi:hypothetical protein